MAKHKCVGKGDNYCQKYQVSPNGVQVFNHNIVFDFGDKSKENFNTIK